MSTFTVDTFSKFLLFNAGFLLVTVFFHRGINTFTKVKDATGDYLSLSSSSILLSDTVMMSEYLQPADWPSAVMTASRFNTKVRITRHLQSPFHSTRISCPEL